MSASFEQFVLRWLSSVAVVKFKGSGYAEYWGICRNHLIPAFGDKPIECFTVQNVQEFVAEKALEGLSPRTVANMLQVLRLVMDYAVRCDLVTENPALHVQPPRQERREMSFLTPEQVRRLIAATCPSWKLLIAFAALTGVRKGEELALTFRDIDLDSMTASISKSMRGGVVSTPKTAASSGVIPLAPSLRQLIEERRSKAPAPDGLVFSRADASPLPDSLPNLILAKSLVAAGLPQIRWHDLRHSWAVAHLQMGTDVATLARLGRWQTAEALLSTYAHFVPLSAASAVVRMDELLGR